MTTVAQTTVAWQDGDVYRAVMLGSDGVALRQTRNDEHAAEGKPMAYRKSGYDLFMAGAPLHACGDLLQVRGWLLAEWERHCYWTVMAECKPTLPHPRVYPDDALWGMVAQSESSDEMSDAIWRSRGY